MISEAELAKTNISISYSISPVKNVICDLSGIIGSSVENLVSAFYPKNISKKANTVITELINNVLENVSINDSEIGIELKINRENLTITVKNAVTRPQFQKVKAHVDLINNAGDVRKLLKETIYARREKTLKGGLGLIRLVAENKFTISVDYIEKYLIVESKISLGGLI